MKMRDIITLAEQADPLLAVAQQFSAEGMTNVRIVRAEWLLHFADAPVISSICAKGFTQGSPMTSKSLSYTSGRSYRKPGINFAYPTDDEAELRFMQNAIPSDGILFRADGVRMRHWEDFQQVAFIGPTAIRPFQRIRMIERRTWAVVDGSDASNVLSAPSDLVTLVRGLTA